LNTKTVTIRKTAIASTVLSAVLLFASAPLLRADEDRSKCQHHIEKAEAKLSHAISRHGERSSQARSAREHLNAERRECWGRHHAWYNAQEGRWHTEQDWDHDRDDHR
jgi:ribosome-associated translation inhibitor RaiA